MESLESKIAKLQEYVDGTDNIVFFGGAGVSTESGIPDFRSQDGLYNQHYKYPPETILSHGFFMQMTEEFYRFYRDKILVDGVLPNKAHLKLAELEEKGKLKAVVTQNIDGLHQAAGSKTVYELHGSVLRNHCMNCGKSFDLEYMKNTYEEGLDDDTVSGAVDAIASADVLIIGGTSLVVYPAAGLINYYRGHKLILVNKGETGMDSRADLVINAPIGEVFSQIKVD